MSADDDAMTGGLNAERPCHVSCFVSLIASFEPDL